jgi:hypothetical protein
MGGRQMTRVQTPDFIRNIENLAVRIKVQQERHEAASGGKVSALKDIKGAPIVEVDYLRTRIYELKRELSAILLKLPEEYWVRVSILIGHLIGDAAKLGSYVVDTPLRQTLDRRRVGRKSGEASGKARAAGAAMTWQDRAVDMANAIRARNPALSIAKTATRVEEQWPGKLPCGHRRLYQVLCERDKDGVFEKK